MEFGKAIKAARNYLDMSQPDLADALGMSSTALLAIEKGGGMQKKTELKILEFFELKGITFENDGIKIKTNSITTIEGEDWWNRCLHDIHQTLVDDKRKELLLMCADDRLSPPSTNDIIRNMRKDGITMRQIIEEGNTYMMGYENEYKWMSKENFSPRVEAIYADKVIICAEDNSKAVVFKDAGLAQNRRNTFNELWKYLADPERSTADERF